MSAVDGWQALYELRERTAALLEAASDGRADPEVARQLLADLRGSWLREKRWRNQTPPPPSVRHIAGPVIDCREYRRSCPGYIVDRRQACSTCGQQLVRGRWAMFYPEGAPVARHGTITYDSTGDGREVPCRERATEGAACAESA